MDEQDEILGRFTRDEITAEELVTQLADLTRCRSGCTCDCAAPRSTELPFALQRARRALKRIRRIRRH